MTNPYRHPIGGCPPELLGFSPSSLAAPAVPGDDWKCTECGCRGYAEVHGSNYSEVRCIGCKRVTSVGEQQS